jgi:hypothetical protein
MLIKVEPAGFFMYSVQLVFDLVNPDGEDQPVRDYLQEHQLEPRHKSQGDYEGRQCESMQFGGCYLGNHLHEVGQIQLRAVQEEVLTEAIQTHLEAQPAEEALGPDDRRQEVLAALVAEFNQESSFTTGEHGELAAELDGDAVRAAARRLLTAK